MKIGLLQCDDLAFDLQAEYGNYPALYSNLLKSADETVELSVWRIHDGELPDDTLEMDGWLISGSKASVYEDKEWITDLCEFIRLLWSERRPLIGVCFGHQVIAKALGGDVALSDRGWGLGVATNPVVNSPSWMVPYHDHLRLVVSHQDQVTKLPPVAETLASSDFCPFFLVQYDENFLGVQGHPEFSCGLGHALLLSHEESTNPESRPAWLESLKGEIDDKLFARWMMDFYRHALVEAQSTSLIRSG